MRWESAAGVAAIGVGTLLVWLVLSAAARRARHRFEALLQRAQEEGGAAQAEAQAEAEAARRRLTALRLLVNGARYALLAAAILLALGQFNVNLGTLLLPAGFLGAAVGLGSQNLIRDVVAGFFIVFEGQFGVGDQVAINGTAGTVEELGLRVTRLRDEAGQVHFFPNGAINTVARQPRGAVSLRLLVLLSGADGASRAAVERAVTGSLRRFETIHDALTGEVQAVPRDDEALEWRLAARPQRVSFLREKLPPRLKAALDATGLETAKGADVEITFAP